MRYLIISFIILSVCSLAAENENLLHMPIEQLLNVEVITAGKTSQEIKDIPASVVVLTRKEIEQYGYNSLEEILESIPGLFCINDYAHFGVKFGIRGFWTGETNRNIIILLNGVNQRHDTYSNYSFNNIGVPVKAIDRIEIVRGPMSVMYGNGAFYGVINIITNKSNANLASLSGGMEETISAFLRTSRKKDEVQFTFNGGIESSNGPDLDYDKMTSINLNNESTDGTLPFQQNYFDLSASYKEFAFNLKYVETFKGVMFLTPPADEGTKFDQTSISSSIRFQKKLSDKLKIKASTSLFSNSINATYDFLFEDFYGHENSKVNSFESELDLFYEFSDNLSLLTGLNDRVIYHINNRYDLPSFGSHNTENHFEYLEKDKIIETRSLFTQIDYEPCKKLKFTGGIRFEQMPPYDLGSHQLYLQTVVDSNNNVQMDENGNPILEPINIITRATYDKDEIEIIPRLATIYTINENHIIKLLYGEAINRPSWFQNMKNSLNTDVTSLLEPEEITTYEVNYLTDFFKNHTISCSFFYNHLENLITRVSEINEEGTYESWNSNAGEMVTKGIEVNIKSTPLKELKLELGCSYQETENETKGYQHIELSYSPNLLSNLKIYYKFNQRYALSLVGNYVDEIYTYWNSDPNENLPLGRIGDKTPAYFKLNTNFAVSNIIDEKLRFVLKINNILDEEIHYPTFTNVPWVNHGTVDSKRKFIFEMKYSF